MEPTQVLPHALAPLALLVFLLGVKHGFDPDHLAAIDALTRTNSRGQPRLARLAGALFALGHGLLVVSVAVLASSATRDWAVPSWLDAFGAWVSVAVLVLLALANLNGLAGSAPEALVLPLGLRSRVFRGVLQAQQPWSIAAVGLLFAVSFDTVSQAALFGLAATWFSGWQTALLLGLLFAAGMLLTDGLNGVWVARLVGRADASAGSASRVMTLAVACLALITAAAGAAVRLHPGFAQALESQSWLLSTCMLVTVLVSFLLATRRQRAAV